MAKNHPSKDKVLCDETSPAHGIISLSVYKTVADDPVGQVLAISQGKHKIPFYRKQLINKSTRVMFGLAQLIIL